MSIAVLKWGILGCGRISEDFANVLLQYPGQHKLKTVAARDGSRAKEFCKKFRAEKWYDDYDNLINAGQIDAVYIGTVHTTHCELAVKSLNAGINVLCEKPLAVNALEVEKMNEAARRNDRLLLEAFWTRFFPSYLRIKNEVDKGTIGEPTILAANFCNNADRALTRLFDKSVAGGATLDLGCYPIMLANYVFGDGQMPVVRASARLNEQGIDMATSITLTYPGDKIAHIITALDTAIGAKQAIIGGSGGHIVIHDPLHAPTKLSINGEEVHFPLPGKEPPYPYRYDGPVREGFCYMISAFYDLITQGKKECELMPLDESLLIAKITDEIRRQIGVRYEQDP